MCLTRAGPLCTRVTPPVRACVHMCAVCARQRAQYSGVKIHLLAHPSRKNNLSLFAPHVRCPLVITPSPHTFVFPVAVAPPPLVAALAQTFASLRNIRINATESPLMQTNMAMHTGSPILRCACNVVATCYVSALTASGRERLRRRPWVIPR